MQNLSSDYPYNSAEPSCSNELLWLPIREIVLSHLTRGSRVIELGCGSGATAAMLTELGFTVTGVDPSASGIRVATEAYPNIRFEERSAYEDLEIEFGEFDAVVSLEVVEHCHWPRLFAKCVFALLRPGGVAIISTPFHGYWKNLALALTGKFDAHWSPLWDGGHIKFWSEDTLRILLDEAGLVDVGFRRVGRLPPIAKSMIAIARKPK